MRISAYVAHVFQLKKLLLLPIVLMFFFLFATETTYAQSPYDAISPTTPIQKTNDFRNPDVDPDVPKNSHSYAQIVLIDVLSAVICQLSGVDPVNPRQPCIDLNPNSGKLGVANNQNTQALGEQSSPQVGGALGALALQIGILYQPSVSSKTYFDYLASNFGIVKPAYAQIPNCNTTGASDFGYGYCGLNPIFSTWKFIRDLSYSFLVIAFVILALGIMLRFKVDPRTVMTLQNQIPRVIIAILLITFSYAIAGVMIDVMWTVTYMGVNALTESSPSQGCAQGKLTPIKELAPIYLLQTPLGYTENIFAKDCSKLGHSGITTLAGGTGAAIGYTLADLIFQFIGMDYAADQEDCGITNIAACARSTVGWLIKIIISLIVLVTLLITLVRLWFQLLKTAVLFMVYTIGGPIWIVFGLLPGRPLGFEKWLRLEFAHLAPFPLVAFMIVLARILADSYPDTKFTPNSVFVPPLIGNPNMNGFGVLMAFGLLLITPGIPDMIKEKMKVPPGKLGGRVQGGIAAGAAVTGGAAGAGWKRVMRKYDPETGREAGSLRQFAYGKVLGMGKAEGVGRPGGPVQTRRYRMARRLMGGSLGVKQDSPRG